MSALDDINWDEVASVYSDGIVRLLRHATPASDISVVLWSDSNGGFNFDIYQKFDDGSQRRLGDHESEWGDQFCHLDEIFEEAAEQLAEEENYDSLDLSIRQRLRDAAESTDFVAASPSGVMNVRWRIQDEIERGEQGGARQPTTAPDSKSEGSEKPKPESEGRSQ
jgi:hypothetical protein